MSFIRSKCVALAASLLFIALQLSAVSPAKAAGAFYATQALQSQAPNAFALQPQASAFIATARARTIEDGDKLVAAILAEPDLVTALSQWRELAIEQQIPFLRKIFALEYQTMAITPPKLVIDNHSYPNKMVYFDFDLAHLSPLTAESKLSSGVVYLNPDKLAQQDKFASLAFLIHETRHSYQFQLSQQQHADSENRQLAAGYSAAFTAQKTLKGFGFSDFLTLLNEYEAFQYGNYVLGQLTQWQLDLTNMGTFASQFDHRGQLKIDLLALSKSQIHGDSSADKPTLLEQYNRAAKRQYQQRQAAKAL